MNPDLSSSSALSQAIASVSDLTEEELLSRLSALNAERAAIRELLRIRRARERELQSIPQEKLPNGGAE